jgi:outer membrane cobalamin receptor
VHGAHIVHHCQGFSGRGHEGTCLVADDALAASSESAKPEAPARLEPVVVSAGRVEQALRDVPANVTVLTRDDIGRSAAQTVDDLLRQISGFSLFRRSSSLVANPTAQGVSLRGIGPSGGSRTLVLLDGVPFNDPSGGWVYWSEVPLESIERIEVVRGDRSAPYGNYALGGVINIVTRNPRALGFRETSTAARAIPSTPPCKQIMSRVHWGWRSEVGGIRFRFSEHQAETGSCWD